jgi:uncharacterized protein (DUF305 family)
MKPQRFASIQKKNIKKLAQPIIKAKTGETIGENSSLNKGLERNQLCLF